VAAADTVSNVVKSSCFILILHIPEHLCICVYSDMPLCTQCGRCLTFHTHQLHVDLLTVITKSQHFLQCGQNEINPNRTCNDYGQSTTNHTTKQQSTSVTAASTTMERSRHTWYPHRAQSQSLVDGHQRLDVNSRHRHSPPAAQCMNTH